MDLRGEAGHSRASLLHDLSWSENLSTGVGGLVVHVDQSSAAQCFKGLDVFAQDLPAAVEVAAADGAQHVGLGGGESAGGQDAPPSACC